MPEFMRLGKSIVGYWGKSIIIRVYLVFIVMI